MRTTLKHIAEYLNVSTTTVSRALNDKDDISFDMRQKVLQVAKLLDYKPNSIAISLRKKTTHNLIGVILPKIDHYFFSTVLRGITTTDSADGHLVIIGETNHDPDVEKEIINRYGDYYVSGVIMAPSRNKESRENVRLIQQRRIPLVLIDRIYSDFNGSYIHCDDLTGAYKATKHLLHKNRRRIAILKGLDECSISEARLNGYKKALREAGIPFDSNLVATCTVDTSKGEGFSAARELFQKPNPPEGIFAITDRLAAGALEFAYSNQINVPKELSIVGYSNSEISENVTPKLTTVNQDGYEMGKLARHHLLTTCKQPDHLFQKRFDANLIVRQSC